MKKKQYKTAIGYLRVSSEGQEKGTSLESQKECIRAFCIEKEILLLEVFIDKSSGKDFNRPQFQKALNYLKENKNEIDLFLTKKIDRFTRNTKEGLEFIEKIKSFGTEVNFVDDWLDDSDSSQGQMVKTIKMAFATYERDVINERCRLGEKAALKGGRYCKTPPKGFLMGKLPNGKACIVLSEDAPLIKALFEDYATGQYAQAELIKKYKPRGLKLSKSSLSRMLDNVLYMGYIDLKKHNVEPYTSIKGLHEPIISEVLFYKVQGIKNGKNRMVKKIRPKNENFPLSGFLLCPICGNSVYGSRSNNGSKKKVRRYYDNYKCSYNCAGQSYKADIIHSEFLKELSKIKPLEEVLNLFKEILLDTYKESIIDIENIRKGINKQISEIEKKKSSLVEKFVEEKIDEKGYKMLSEKYEKELFNLNIEKAKYEHQNEDLDKFLTFGMSLLSNPDVYYEKSTIETKVKIIGSYFTEKLIFENGKFRTLPFNEAIMLIYNKINKLQKKEKEKEAFFQRLPT